MTHKVIGPAHRSLARPDSDGRLHTDTDTPTVPTRGSVNRKVMTMAEWLEWATENTDTYADDTEL